MTILTDTGIDRPTQAEIADDILTDQRQTISAQFTGSASSAPGNINQIFADQLDLGWAVLEEVVNMFDPDNATGSRLTALALLTGVEPRGATRGLVTVTLNLDAGQSYVAGDIVMNVTDKPNNLWENRDAAVSTGSGNYDVVFRSVATGSAAVAPAGTLTVFPTPVSGVNSGTNAVDATPGQDEESEEALRLRRDASLAVAGGSTLDAIRADLSAVEGVLQVLVEENTSDVAVNGMAPHSVRAVVWDGSPAAADNDEIAQAMHQSWPAGIGDNGALSGQAIDANGNPKTFQFDRAAVLDLYVSVNIESAVGVSADDVKAAIVAAMPIQMGKPAVYNKLTCAVFMVDGVDDWSTFTLGTTPSPTGTADITPSSFAVLRLQTSNITLTGDVS